MHACAFANIPRNLHIHTMQGLIQRGGWGSWPPPSLVLKLCSVALEMSITIDQPPPPPCTSIVYCGYIATPSATFHAKFLDLAPISNAMGNI